ncbi:MAG: LamG domain-containing protein [Prevotella sp.]|nr:LamG domain-containing protein [Prevotella sp.]
MKTRRNQLWLRCLTMIIMLFAAVKGVQADGYITELMTIGDEDSRSIAQDYRDKGWTVVDKDLNAGAKGWYIFLAYKTSTTATPETGYITDICASTKCVDNFSFEGRTYYRASNNSGFNGNLNRGISDGTDIYLYYTRERINLGTFGGDMRVISSVTASSNSTPENPTTTGAVSWRNASHEGLCDFNHGAGGEYVYLHQHFNVQKTWFKVKPTFASNLTFNGKKQNLVTSNPWKANNGHGELKYRINGGEWSSQVPMATNVGTYKVEAQLFGHNASGIVFAKNSDIISSNVTINPPIAKAKNLNAVFNQGDKQVFLTWGVGSIAGGYDDYDWVIYRDGEKIAKVNSQTHTYADKAFTNESTVTYEVFYVSRFWDENTQRSDTKATVKVSTVRNVPINNMVVEQQSDRIVFTWTSDGYAEGFGNQFWIYIDNEEDPAYKLKATGMQTNFRWEHRSTDQHTNRQAKTDPETGVPYCEEPLNACEGHVYTIKGVIGNTILNTEEINTKAIGNATLFYDFDASKGAHEGVVKLTWHVNQQGSVVAKTYIVERRRAEQDDDPWEKMSRMSSNEEYLFFTDETALPGVFYDYRVTVEDKCSDGNTISNDISDIGFAKGTGTVTGRIAFGATGTSVQDVEVVLSKQSKDDEGSEQFHALYFNGAHGAASWQYPSESYAAEKFSADDFSLQLWLYPEEFSNAKVVNFGQDVALGMTESGQLTFNNQTFADISLRKDSYNHIVLTRSAQTVTCYVLNNNSNSSQPDVQKTTLALAGNLSLESAKEMELGHFRGAIDELRLWTKCLSETAILENYDHLLVGDEQYLETYWTFDEGLQTQFFDYSRDGTNYRKHHGRINNNVQPAALTPDALALKTKTDEDGNYVIQGVPFAGEGTTYSVAPLFGIHEFNPNTKLIFVSKNALVHNVDFVDVSSFVMSGYIYYAGTNVPVEGAQMFVDGMLQTTGGKVEQTDENGYYEISVPIGDHFVEAKLSNHVMANEGRWPANGTYYFDRHFQHDFIDSTLVNFAGRIGGGLANDTLAVGHGMSKNNIGIATIQLALNNESFSLNCLDDHISDAPANRGWESDTTSINSHAWTGTSYDAKYIYIRTDSVTGEFSAMLPPLKFRVKNLTIDTNHDIDFGALPEIDLTNVNAVYTDTLNLEDEDGNVETKLYSYNVKMVKAYYAEPQLEITQLSANGDGDAPRGIFGRRNIEDYTDDFGTTTVTDIWKEEGDGIKYTYGYPIYDSGDKVRMEIWGYEAYVNNDAQPAVADTIALNAQLVTISNEMSDEQLVVAKVENEELGLQPGDIYNLKKNQLILDERGKNEFTFQTGAPNIVAPYTRQLSMSIERNNRTYSYVGVNAIVLGSLTTGTNFITLGPDKVTMVLRDPPGATSKTTWTTGSAKTKMKSTAQGYYGDEKFVTDFISGTKLKTFVGVGTLVEFGKVKAVGNKGGGFHYTVNRGNQTDETWTVTATKSVSTGTGSVYVGADGDVFIGVSTNIIVGDSRKVGLFRKGEGYPFELELRDGKSMGDSLVTTFMYSTYELEKVMIPKWEETRRSLFVFLDSKQEAENYVNSTDHCVYTTWLSKDDPNLGLDDTTYIQKLPKGSEPNTFYDDSVKWCTSQIETWKQVMANNEKDKLEAIQGEDTFLQNISFDGGSPNSYSNRCDTTYQYKELYNHKLGGIFNIGGVTEGSGASIVFKTTAQWTTENGWSMSTAESDEDENTKDWAQFDYSFSDGNKGTDFSVNIYKSPKGWSDSFFLVGGQSYNPYEGEQKTKYYEPGLHTLSNGTEQMERPSIRISIDGNADNSAKKVTLSDVPAGQAGQLTLHLTNLSSTSQGFDFSYNIVINEKNNQQGLEILMDGVPANGRSVFIPANETVKKIITVRQTDQSVLDYENLEIAFCSQYQAIKIRDVANFDVHFKPSSSPISLDINETVLNLETLQRNKGNLEMKLYDFNRQFKGMRRLGVEYLYEGATSWTQPSELQFVLSEADQQTLGGNLLPATGNLNLVYDMGDANMYPEGSYTFRAYTRTDYGTEPVYVYSDEIRVVKDSNAPRQLTTPLPTNGVLGYGEDMVVEFNEDIVPGYVSDKNVIVTSKLNNQEIDHEVSKLMLGNYLEQRTVNPVFINSDFSVEFWMIWTKEGSILDHGKGRYIISIDEEGHVVIEIAGTKMVSKDTLPKQEWIFFAMNCDTNDATISIIAQYGTNTVKLFTNEPVPIEAIQAVSYYDDNYMYLGSMSGAIHDLCFYSLCRDLNNAAAEKYKAKDGYVYGLKNYWPMREGHGTIAYDMRHTHDFITNGMWNLSYYNQALEFRTGTPSEVDIADINTYPSDSYAIELWARPGSTKVDDTEEQTIFETGSATTDKLRLYYNKEKDLLLQYGENQSVVANSDDFWTGFAWHHMALNVVRGQAASFYYDGMRTAVIAEIDVPSLSGNTMSLGKGMGYEGRIDELRIWHATLSESRILNNMYNVIDTTSIYSRGLVAYYPFEKKVTKNNMSYIEATWENMAPNAHGTLIKGDDITHISQYAPPLKEAPEEKRLIAKPIASERKVVISLAEGSGISARDIEGTTLNITVDKIHDLNGNQSDPIKWTAYVQRNTLKWSKDSITVIKDLGSTYDFDIDIVNKSGNTEYVTLSHMPEWLIPIDAIDETPLGNTGEIPPLTTYRMRFRVLPTVPVGNYDASIAMQGNQEITEPLRIVMKVRGQTPTWTVDPNQYENTMSIVGQVYINGVLMANKESLVAAFIDGQCRGVANVMNIRNAAFIAMNIYGTAQQNVNGEMVNLDYGKPVTFRIWDASKGVAYANVNATLANEPLSITFDDSKTIGDFSHPVIFTKSDLVEQELKIKAGWNWLSLGVEPVDTKTSEVLQNVSTWNVFIKDRSTGTYFCNGYYWDGTLTDMHANNMYKMNLTKLSKSTELPSLLSVMGLPVKLADTKVTLKKNWNWISYLPTTSMTLDVAFAGANPQQGDQIKSQQGFAIYGPYGWDGNLQVLESGKGYLYYSVDENTKEFVYPSMPAIASARVLSRQEAGTQPSTFSPVEPESYPDNMSMVVKLVRNREIVSDAEIAAFIDNECRGAATAFVATDPESTSYGLYYLLIAGEGRGKPMQLRVAVGGSIIDISNDIPFNSDAIIGTPWEPLVIDLDNTQGIADLAIDETDTEWYNLQGVKLGRRPKVSGVYIHHGKKEVIRQKR